MPNHCNQWLMRCVQHTGNSNYYLACRGTKPREAIDYLFDMLLKPEGQDGTRMEGKKELSRSDKWMQTDRQTKFAVFECVQENPTQGRREKWTLL